MDENINDGGPFLRPLGWGIELLHDSCETAILIGRWRFILFNPRFRENWRIEFIRQDDLWQVGIGPLAVVHVPDSDEL